MFDNNIIYAQSDFVKTYRKNNFSKNMYLQRFRSERFSRYHVFPNERFVFEHEIGMGRVLFRNGYRSAVDVGISFPLFERRDVEMTAKEHVAVC